jgi:branched-chain amino acid transport system substrate-binding protein
MNRITRTASTAFKPLALAAGLALAGLGTAAQAQVSDGVVRIGVLTDLSGVYSDVSGKGTVVATQMAIDDFLAKEKPSFKVELVSADHQNKGDIAANKAREWFEQGKVDVASELVTTSVALAVQKIAKEKNRIALISGAASTRITNEDCNDVTVHWTYDTYAVANGTARAVTKAGGKKWFFLTADYAFGHSLEKDAGDVVKASGGEVVGTVRHPFPGSDFSSFLLKAQSSGAQIIGLANAGGDTINSIKQAAEFGITPKQQLAGLLMFITDIHSLGLKNTQSMYLTEGFYWNLNDETRAWSKRFFDLHKRMPTMVQAGQYSSVMHYLKAVKTTGTDDTAKVMAEMKKTPVNDFFAKNGSIRADGRMVHDMYLLQVKKPAESTTPWDYYHVRATIPAAEAFQPLSASKCPLVKK